MRAGSVQVWNRRPSISSISARHSVLRSGRSSIGWGLSGGGVALPARGSTHTAWWSWDRGASGQANDEAEEPGPSAIGFVGTASKGPAHWA